jgi:hypothetical protein
MITIEMNSTSVSSSSLIFDHKSSLFKNLIETWILNISNPTSSSSSDHDYPFLTIPIDRKNAIQPLSVHALTEFEKKLLEIFHSCNNLLVFLIRQEKHHSFYQLQNLHSFRDPIKEIIKESERTILWTDLNDQDLNINLTIDLKASFYKKDSSNESFYSSVPDKILFDTYLSNDRITKITSIDKSYFSSFFLLTTEDRFFDFLLHLTRIDPISDVQEKLQESFNQMIQIAKLSLNNLHEIICQYSQYLLSSIDRLEFFFSKIPFLFHSDIKQFCFFLLPMISHEKWLYHFLSVIIPSTLNCHNCSVSLFCQELIDLILTLYGSNSENIEKEDNDGQQQGLAAILARTFLKGFLARERLSLLKIFIYCESKAFCLMKLLVSLNDMKYFNKFKRRLFSPSSEITIADQELLLSSFVQNERIWKLLQSSYEINQEGSNWFVDLVKLHLCLLQRKKQAIPLPHSVKYSLDIVFQENPKITTFLHSNEDSLKLENRFQTIKEARTFTKQLRNQFEKHQIKGLLVLEEGTGKHSYVYLVKTDVSDNELLQQKQQQYQSEYDYWLRKIQLFLGDSKIPVIVSS